MKRFTLALFALLVLAHTARAEEGMWTFNRFPADAVAKRYGFRADEAWLDQVRMASVRLAQGCSGSFVSPNGLVMTNHHCAHRCIEQLSTPEKDLVATGFSARTEADEVRCPELEVNQLVAITDVTETVTRATKDLEGKAFHEAQKAAIAKLESSCQTSDELRCDVVTLYHGGRYDLYRYRRHQDVRLVFAPEFDIAFFGGDPDNFMFPRYDLDVTFLRVYDGGKPAATSDYFRFSEAGSKAGELTFVSGHPGRTSRELTIAQLAFKRDVELVDSLVSLAELRGLLTEYQRRGPEQKRHSTATLFGVENSFKGLRGRLEALQDPGFFASKVRAEEAFRAALAKRRSKAASAFDGIARAQAEYAKIREPLRYVEQGEGFRSKLFSIARSLVRAAAEREKPNEVRLEEYAEAALPALTLSLFSRAPIHDELQTLLLGHSLAKMREALTPDHPVVKKVLGSASPEALAQELVKGTKLADPAERKRLWDGGRAAIEASTDPMIQLARLVDEDARALRKRYEDDIESVIKKNEELLAKARFAVYGTSVYPDATFSLRLSVGQVKGWTEGDTQVEPFTRFAGAFTRATGSPPFALPASWLAAKDSLDLDTPFDFVTTNDIIGGNSGSPVINSAKEVVGLVFDGNIWSLGGEYGFDERNNRTVAVSSPAMLEALRKIYRAERLTSELVPAKAAATR